MVAVWPPGRERQRFSGLDPAITTLTPLRTNRSGDLRRAGSHSPAVAASRPVCPDGCKFRFSLAAHARHAAACLLMERSSLSAARGNRQEASRVMDAWVAPGPV